MRDERKLIEYAQYVNNYYGTPKEYVEQKMAEGKDVILRDRDPGSFKSKETFPGCAAVICNSSKCRRTSQAPGR